MFFILIGLVLIAGTTAIVLKRRRRVRAGGEATPPASEAATSVEEKARRPFVTRLRQRVASVLPGLPQSWRKRGGGVPQAVRLQFNTWLAKVCAEEEPLRTWLQQLAEPEAQTFIDQLGAFCTAKGIELPSMLEPRPELYNELVQAAEEVVLHYCRACHQAAAAQEDFAVYKTLLAFERNPADVKTREFGQKLFAKVSEAGLTTVSLSEYLLADPPTQHRYVLQAIHEAPERHRTIFIRLLHELARHEEATPAAPSPAPAKPAMFTSGAQAEVSATSQGSSVSAMSSTESV